MSCWFWSSNNNSGSSGTKLLKVLSRSSQKLAMSRPVKD